MTQTDHSRSVHLAAVNATRPVLGDLPPEFAHGPDVADPLSVDLWADRFNAAWGILAAGCFVAMLVVGFLLGVPFGDAGRKTAIPFGAAAGFFCLAGSVAALWGRYVFFPRARRRFEAGDHAAYERNLRRSLPTNRSVVFQAAVGALAAYIAAVNL